MSDITSPSPAPSTSSGTSPLPGRRLSNEERFWIIHILGMAQIVLGVGLDVVNAKVRRKMLEIMETNVQFHKITNLPGVQSIKHMWLAASGAGKTTGLYKGGRKKLPIREEVEYMFEVAPASMRSMARTFERTDIPGKRTTIHRIVNKELGKKAYKRPYGAKLTLDDIERRLEWAIIMHDHLMVQRDIDLNNVLWTDECKVIPSACSNRQNDRIWRHPLDWEPYEHLEEKAHYDQSVMIWVGVHSIAGTIGPYFCEDIEQLPGEKKTLNSARYIRLLEEKIIPELKSKLTPEQFAACWFQQDGAAVHTARDSLACLRRHFGRRVISLKTALIWPPHSPDMSPLDYWFWASMKMLLNQYDEAANIEEFKGRITDVCRLITPDACKKAIGDFRLRLQALIHAKGAHFEPTFKKFKTEVLKMSTVCEVCDTIHECPCAVCDDLCLEDAFMNRFRDETDKDQDQDQDEDQDEGVDQEPMDLSLWQDECELDWNPL